MKKITEETISTIVMLLCLAAMLVFAAAVAKQEHDRNEKMHNTHLTYAVVDEDGYFYEDGSFHPTWGNPADAGYEVGSTVEIMADNSINKQDAIHLIKCVAFGHEDHTTVVINGEYHIFDDIAPQYTLSVIIDTHNSSNPHDYEIVGYYTL